jgi:2-oxoisovalerate dehydrogenase E2 component (dihydrolipoyl transacylase)
MSQRDFNLPDLGEGLEDAEVVRWLVSEGDEVELNQPIVEVDTAKALVEIPSPFKGKVLKLHGAEGDTVKVGEPLITFELEGEEESGRTSVLVGYGVDEKSKVKRRRRLSSAAEPAAEPSSVAASPPVRRLAAEMGVDLGSIRGSGPGGRITRDDVLAATGSSTEAAGELGPEERLVVKGVRRLIAERMTRSASEIPHVTTFLSVDCTALLAVRDEVQRNAADLKVSPLPVLAKAFLEVCKEYPKLNASFDAAANEIVLKKYYHLGVATDTERGLIVPVVRDADGLDFLELAKQISRLSTAVRDGTAAVDEVSGSTVTISNVGSFGAESGTPIINYPEAAILAFGVIQDRPVAREGRVEILPMTTLSLSFDHRMTDGAEAGRALLALKNLLEDGEKLRALS